METMSFEELDQQTSWRGKRSSFYREWLEKLPEPPTAARFEAPEDMAQSIFAWRSGLLNASKSLGITIFTRTIQLNDGTTSLWVGKEEPADEEPVQRPRPTGQYV